jgi:hypothetical protein
MHEYRVASGVEKRDSHLTETDRPLTPPWTVGPHLCDYRKGREKKRRKNTIVQKNAVGVVVSGVVMHPSVPLTVRTALYVGKVAWERGLFLVHVYDACRRSSLHSGFPVMPLSFVPDEEAEEHGGIHIVEWYQTQTTCVTGSDVGLGGRSRKKRTRGVRIEVEEVVGLGANEVVRGGWSATMYKG